MKPYYRITKPGIIYGNALTATGGFLLAFRGHVDILLLVATLIGMSLVIASACVFNNVVDRDIDGKMSRTKNRAMVTGVITTKNALLYATVLGVVGAGVLAAFVNMLVVGLGLAALFSYVVLYGWAKRSSVHGTLVGTIPGAAPVVAGYAAVTGRLDLGALLLFLILVFWQLPHFYAIALYRLKDYQAAGIPVWPAKRGVRSTKIYILVYIMAFIIAALSLSMWGYAGWSFGVVMALLGAVWFYRGLRGFGTTKTTPWARQMFKFSLIVILAFSIMLSLDSVV